EQGFCRAFNHMDIQGTHRWCVRYFGSGSSRGDGGSFRARITGRLTDRAQQWDVMVAHGVVQERAAPSDEHFVFRTKINDIAHSSLDELLCSIRGDRR